MGFDEVGGTRGMGLRAVTGEKREFLDRHNEVAPFLALVFGAAAAVVGFVLSIPVSLMLPHDAATLYWQWCMALIFGGATTYAFYHAWNEPEGWRRFFIGHSIVGLWLGLIALLVLVFEKMNSPAMIVGALFGGVLFALIVGIVPKMLDSVFDWMIEPLVIKPDRKSLRRMGAVYAACAFASALIGILLARDGIKPAAAGLAGFGCFAFGPAFIGIAMRVFGWHGEEKKLGFFARLHNALETLSKINSGIWSVFWSFVAIAFGAAIAAGVVYLIRWMWPPRPFPGFGTGFEAHVDDWFWWGWDWLVIALLALFGWFVGIDLAWGGVKEIIRKLAGVTRLGKATVHGRADLASEDQAVRAVEKGAPPDSSSGLNLNY